ncbi:MAG: rhomboid family intramembrane serine protease [Haloferacaceae archaeon]
MPVRDLVPNAVALALVGFPLERFTTRTRFHIFVLLTGMVAGVSQSVVGGLVGRPTAVLGASGAILALYGYALAGNPLTGGLLVRLEIGRRAKLLLLAGGALAVTVLTAGPGVALRRTRCWIRPRARYRSTTGAPRRTKLPANGWGRGTRVGARRTARDSNIGYDEGPSSGAPPTRAGTEYRLPVHSG